MSQEDELIKVPEMARRLGVGEATVYRLIQDGRIPARQKRWGLTRRIYLVRRADFERVLPQLMRLADDATIEESQRPAMQPVP